MVDVAVAAAAAEADAPEQSNRTLNIASAVESTNGVTEVEVRVINSVLAYEKETKPAGPITIIRQRTRIRKVAMPRAIGCG